MQLDGSGSRDADNDSLTYFWSFTSVPTGSIATLLNDTAMNPTFVPEVAGLYVVQLITNDGKIDSDPVTVTITVTEPPSSGNHLPVADAGPDQTVQMGWTVPLDGSGSSDPDGDSLTYQWTLTSVPTDSTAAVDRSGHGHSFLRCGRYRLLHECELTVSDGKGGSATAITSVTANLGNRAPTVSLSATLVSGSAPLSVTFTATATDPDHDPLTYTWDFGDGATAYEETTQSHRYGAARTYTATVTVSDGQDIGTAGVDITVIAGPDPKTRVIGRAVDLAGNSVVGAHVTCLTGSDLTTSDGTFSVSGLPTRSGDMQCTATFVTTAGKTLEGISQNFPPIPGGTTDVGDIVLRDGAELRYPGLRLPVGSYPQFVVVADLNGDSKLDLAVPSQGSQASQGPGTINSGVSLLFGKGDGTFQAEQRLNVGGAAFEVAAADINQDGVRDLIVTRFGPTDTANPYHSVVALLGNGNGSFQSPLRSNVYSPGPLAVTDMNGDGKLDLVVGNHLGSTLGNSALSLLLGNGDGTFQPPQSLFSGVSDAAIAVADVNSDHISDILAAGAGSPDGVSVLLGNGNGTFRNAQIFPVRFDPRAIIVRDLNGDGILDIATANVSGYTVSVLLGNGNGTFQAERQFPSGSNPFSLAAEDLNHDGILDLIVGNEISFSKGDFAAGRGSNTDTVSVLFGNGDGTFQARQTFTVDNGPHSVAIADINADNNADIVAVNRISDDVSVLTGNGDGTFPTQKRFATGNFPSSLVVGDFNGDRIRDAVTTNSLSSDLSLLLGNGDGTFQARQSFAPGPPLVSAVAADVNGDRILDLVAIDSGARAVSVLRGNGNGTFQDRVSFPVGSLPAMVVVADVNADGSPDLVTANTVAFDSYHVSVLLGNGDGTFQPPSPVELGPNFFFSEGGGPKWVAVADLNGDGKLDLTVITGSSGAVFTLLGNGDATFRAPQRLTAENGSRSVTAADINVDGRPDLVISNGASGDVSVFLGNGNGTFQAARHTTGSGDLLHITDLNFDGFPDLVLVEELA